MKDKLTTIILLAIITLSVLAVVLIYPILPDQVAVHWNIYGQVDGYTNKFWGLVVAPVILTILFLLYFFIPKIDPLKANINKFRKYYNSFWVFVFAFFVYIFGLQIIWSLGYEFDFIKALVPAIATLFYAAGVLTENAKRNWMIGIRTPWTLSSDRVWKKTHALGGKLFKIAAIVSLAGVLAPPVFAFWLVIGPVVAVAIFITVYSYLEYKKSN